MNYSELFEKEYWRLNDQQKAAVDSIYGQIMVVAWPGTGKTQIIGLRTANIIKQAAVNPANILITTFTDAWVIAIRKRLIDFLGNDAYKVNVSTIHSLSSDIIKTFPEKFIEYKASNLVDDVDGYEIIKNIIDNSDLEFLISQYDSYYYLQTIKSKISTLKQEWVSPAKLQIAIDKQIIENIELLGEIKPTLKKYESTRLKQEANINKLLELKKIYISYQEALKQRELYDFNDMINFVLEKLEQDQELREHYAEEFQFIMLDEYQDTNNAQNQIIDLILSVADEPNIMTVWDDDQSIYRFQWANIENMLDFSVTYPNTQFIVLQNNYRSSQNILDISTNLISNNNERLINKIPWLNKSLLSSGSEKDNKTKTTLLRAKSDLVEKEYIIESIKKLLEQGEDIREIAIIVRWNKEVWEWTQTLLKNNIEAESKLKSNILDSKYIKFILNFLEVIDDPYTNEEKFLYILESDILGLDKLDIIKINRNLYIKNYSRKFKLKLFDHFSNLENLTEWKERWEDEEKKLEFNNIEKLIAFRELYTDLKWNKSSIIEFFNSFIEQINILEYIEKHWDFYDTQDIYTLFNKIKDFSQSSRDFSIKNLIEKIDLHINYRIAINRQIVSDKLEWVQILTAHWSKWLEFNHVFIPGLYSWNWEGKKTRDLLKIPVHINSENLQNSNFEQIEEDRRLFFVALTRARKELHLSFPAGIGTKAYLASSLLEELWWDYEEITFSTNNDYIVNIINNDIKNNLTSHNELEFEYIISFFEKYRLTASDLNTFIMDPLLFLNRVIYKYPFIWNSSTIFGTVYHRALELFYLKYKSENNLPSKEYLIWEFNKNLSLQLLSPEDFELLKQKWEEWLSGYYDLYSQNSKIPVELEYSFRRKNILFNEIPLSGTIDKVELEKDSEVNLIDYKTGKAKTITVIKWLDRYWNKKDITEHGWYFRQLLFYKLLCDNDNDFKYHINSLAIDFAEWKDWNYKYVEVDYTQEEYEEFKVLLSESYSKMTDINFWKELLEKK